MTELETLIQLRRDLRDTLSEITSTYEDKKRKITAAVEDTDSKIRVLMDAMGVKSARTNAGIATLKTTTRYNVTDWGKVEALILRLKDPSFLQRRLATTRLRQYMDDEGMEDLPDGITSVDLIEVSITKPTA